MTTFSAFTYGTPTVPPASLVAVIALIGPVAAAINPNPVPFASVLPPATVGSGYSEQISAQGGIGPWMFSIVGGALPPGLAMNSAGLVSGTSAGTGTYSFTVKSTDTRGVTGTQVFSITAANPLNAATNYGFAA